MEVITKITRRVNYVEESALMIPMFSIAGYVTALCTSSLAGFVYLRNKRSKINQIFFFYSIAIAQWSLFTGWHAMTSSAIKSLFAARMMHIGVACIPILFFHFCLTISNLQKKYFREMVVGYCMCGCFILVNLFTGLIVPQVRPKLGYMYFMDGGKLYPVLLVYFTAFILYGLKILFVLYRDARGARRTQLMYLFFGSLIGYIMGPSCFMPVYDITLFPYPYGSYGIVLYAGITAYAVVKHHLMDINIAIKKAVVFAGLFAALCSIFAGVAFFGQLFLEERFGWNIKHTIFPSFIIIIMLFKPLERLLVRTTDNFLFQKEFDYKLILMQFINEIITELDLERIIHGTEYLINHTIKPERFVMYLWDKEAEVYRAQTELKDIDLSIDSALVGNLKDNSNPISIHDRGVPELVVKEMKRQKVELAMPLHRRDQFLGFVFLGGKKSDERYDADDIRVLNSLSNALAVAILNSESNTELAKSKLLDSLGSMADGMSHQFNNVFGVILNQLQLQKMLIDQMKQESRGRKIDEQVSELWGILETTEETMDKVIGDAKRGGGIARSVLIMTRPEKAGFQMNNVVDSLEAGIRTVRFRHNDFDKQIPNLQMDIADNLPKTWSNESLLANIYQIAIHNAYDAIAKRDKSAHQDKGLLTISIVYRGTANTIRITMQDNGVGMQPYILKAVNEGVPYVSTKGTASDKSGFGAGVHTLANYVRLLMGEHYFESEWGKGAKLTIDLPVMDKEEYDRRRKQEEKKGINNAKNSDRG